MSNPVVPGAIVDDPKRPWKAVVPLLVGVLYAIVKAATVALGDGSWDPEDTSDVISAGVLALVTAVGVFLKSNPKKFANGL